MSLPKIYTDENAAREHLEKLLWPEGPLCPHCGNSDPARIRKLEGKSTRPGVFKCNECRKPFSVTVGTVFERSHIPLHKWVYATHLLTSSKKGMSSHQLMRMLDVTYKTAWFMSHRIREGMRPANPGPMGGSGKIIESDETYWGSKDKDTTSEMKARRRGKPGPGGKAKILTLVERDGGARSFKMSDFKNETVQRVLFENVRRESRLMTDEGTSMSIGRHFAKHETVKHGANEYVRGDVTTNTVEGYFSIFKRGMRGVYQHCAEKHLHRYLSEFDFRYSNRSKLGIEDAERADRALQGITGKRLTYRRTY
jgi:transposase-like protein